MGIRCVIMPKFTKMHYIAIGDIIRKTPKKDQKKEGQKWSKVFAKDNPRFNPKTFKSFVGF
tara:strand:+ start:214 stop:396 length:183 start_codon:yes stop_codon:yes gene_type:complete